MYTYLIEANAVVLRLSMLFLLSWKIEIFDCNSKMTKFYSEDYSNTFLNNKALKQLIN